MPGLMRRRFLVAPLLALLLCAAAPERAADGFAMQREAMVEAVERMATGLRVKGAERIAPAVLRSMRIAPRHLLVPSAERHSAYENRPLPIGHEQTISQPFIVALMTHLLAPRPGHVVLEVGTGSGYQAARSASGGTISIV